MKYWVYENWVHEYARIHKVDCEWCNNGKGCHGDSTDKYGQWLGSFKSKEEAELAARKTKRKKVSHCSRCL